MIVPRKQEGARAHLDTAHTWSAAFRRFWRISHICRVNAELPATRLLDLGAASRCAQGAMRNKYGVAGDNRDT